MARSGLSNGAALSAEARSAAADPLPGSRVVRFPVSATASVGAESARRPRPAALRPLGQLLVEAGDVRPGDLLKALVIQGREDAPLSEILLGNGWITPAALARALSRQWRTGVVDLVASPPDARLIDAFGVQACLAEGLAPWRRIGGVTFVAAHRPEDFARAEVRLRARFGPVRMMLAPEAQVLEAVLAPRRQALLRAAELSVPAPLSCRTRNEARVGDIALAGLGLLAVALLLAPLATLAALTAVAATVLALCTGLRVLAFQAWLTGRRHARARAGSMAALEAAPEEVRAPLPVISVLVPLFHEADIAPRLIARLAALTYPRELTDVVLIVEEDDGVTRSALAEASLPRWLRVVVVPGGRVQTKPRALNYALNFARGSIVGIWDAEDWPDPEQLHKVARRFAAAPAEVACLQGMLDFYAPCTNWLSRCFTIEYGSWFRLVLPGMARLGLVVPLGGTTLFLRRAAIERVGGWDAWNVTEDADLGMRLARFGLRTEMIDSVTQEEPNCRPRSWIRQRSRWHKGYFMTWATHMRDPAQLWRDIGPAAFLGFQLQMLGTVTGFVLAPVLWGYMAISLGLGHPLAGLLGDLAGGWALPGLFTLFVAAEAINLVIGLIANGSRGRRHLWPFVPLMCAYFPLATLAAWKALWEVVVDPFSWDKTAHGLVVVPDAPPPTEAAALSDGLALARAGATPVRAQG